MHPIRLLRMRAGLTQARLAQLGETSQPTIAAYEAGRKAPTLSTLDRLARASGMTMAVDFVSPLTREDRRSLALHEAVSERLVAAPKEVVRRARRTLALMRKKHPQARSIFRAWDLILELPLPYLVEVLHDPRPHARELRHASPFAGVLSAPERAKVYRDFASAEKSSR